MFAGLQPGEGEAAVQLLEARLATHLAQMHVVRVEYRHWRHVSVHVLGPAGM